MLTGSFRWECAELLRRAASGPQTFLRPPPCPVLRGGEAVRPRRAAHGCPGPQSAALTRAAARTASCFYLQSLELSVSASLPFSALQRSVRQALSSVGSHLRVNIISDGHNRLE